MDGGNHEPRDPRPKDQPEPRDCRDSSSLACMSSAYRSLYLTNSPSISSFSIFAITSCFCTSVNTAESYTEIRTLTMTSQCSSLTDAKACSRLLLAEGSRQLVLGEEPRRNRGLTFEP